MAEKFSDIREDFLEKWISAVEQAGIPKRAYSPQVKLIKDEKGVSPYTFGAIFNPYRFERPFQKKENITGCPMCSELKSCDSNTYKDLAPDISPNFLVTYNAFPHIIGSSMAIAKNVNGEEKPMYDTRNLENLALELNEVFNIADQLGLKVFHNNYGAGASIPNHEHWHLLNFGSAYDSVGEMYGFDTAEKFSSRKNRTVKVMQDFPFAHLIFDPKDPELIVEFLRKLGNEIGGRYPYGHVPHSICQGEEGVLITPNKVHREKCLGSSDVAGHYLDCKSTEEFENISFECYISKLDEILFRKKDIDLEKFL